MHAQISTFHASWINTPLGKMIAIADDHALHCLAFEQDYDLAQAIKQLKKHTNASILPAHNPIITSITCELEQYFAGKLTIFTTPIAMHGSPFQKSVWQALATIPYGTTYSYAQQAAAINNPNAYRAVGSANSRNLLTIIIPCHRVINANGALGGYAGSFMRKQWLLTHEAKTEEALLKNHPIDSQ